MKTETKYVPLALTQTDLEWLVRIHREAYYAGNPTISDAEFDRIVDELRDRFPDSSVLQDVGAPVGETAVKRPHKIPMGSLEKTTINDIPDYGPVIVQEKYDGISIALEYEQGKLVAAVTRGDGEVGEDVTHNAIWRNVKKELPLPFTGSLRGEVVLSKSNFQSTFVTLGFANPRNTVSGTVRRKQDSEQHNKWFEVYYFDVVNEDVEYPSETAKMQYIYYSLGLVPATTHYFLIDTANPQEKVLELYERYCQTRNQLDYEIDGLVVKADSVELQKQLGSTGNRPKWARAIKFPNQGAWTTLKSVDWQLGVGGRVTPVARLEPVQVGGVTVQNATLHHAGYISSLGLCGQTRVFVERAGDVIPQITHCEPNQHPSAQSWVPPTACPTCKQPLSQEGKFLVCPHLDCPGKSFGNVVRWIRELEIDAIGDVWVKTLCTEGLVQAPSDLYRLKKDRLLTLPRMGTVLAEKILVNIHLHREPTLDKYIAGLNIPGFSRQRAQKLIEAGHTTLKKLLALTKDQILAVPGFGEQVAQVVLDGLRSKANTIAELTSQGVVPKDGRAKPSDGPLVGKSFCFTGAINRTNPATKSRWTRPQLEGLVKQRGGDTRSSVSRGLTYLVMANPNSTSSKTKKAKELDVEILSEDAFFEMLQS